MKNMMLTMDAGFPAFWIKRNITLMLALENIRHGTTVQSQAVPYKIALDTCMIYIDHARRR